MTLHVAVAPGDWRHAEHVLPHQLRQWGRSVDDVQLTLDLRPSKGRFGGGTPEDVTRLRRTLERACEADPRVHVREVDYSAPAAAAVAERFLDGRPVPVKSHYGAAYYSYLYGWHTARHDAVLHVDSDMLFGGGSPTWTTEALDLLAARADVVLCSPLPGPPTADGVLPPHVVAAHSSDGSDFHVEPLDWPAYGMRSCSTRVLLMDRRTLVRRLAPIRVRPPHLAGHVRARLEGQVPAELPEATLSRRMRETGQQRVDLLGSGAGMWSLHPPLRSEEFYAALPSLVERVETGDVPDAQRGDYDVNDSLVDWTSARAASGGQGWPAHLRRRARRLLRR